MNNLVSVKVVNHIGTIEDNLEAVEFSIMQKVSEYSAMVFTEEMQKDGKRFLAEIRKEKKLLDDERKMIKAEWMKPYDDFECRAKQIINLYDEPIDIINKQLEEYEKRRQELKKEEVHVIYESIKGDMEEWLPFEEIYDKRWENATYSEKKIREDMGLLFDQMRLSILTIKDLKSEFEKEGLLKLKITKNLHEAKEEINFLQQMKEVRAAYRKEEHPYQEQTEQKSNEDMIEGETFQSESIEQTKENKIAFKVYVSKEQVEELKTLLQANELQYEVIV